MDDRSIKSRRAMNGAVRLRLLGGFELSVAEAGAMRLPRKSRAMLAYLAIEGRRPCSREFLGELLWPNSGPQQMRDSMRQAIFVLRRAIAGPVAVIRSGDGLLSLASDAVDCDIFRLLSLHEAATRDELRVAMNAYAGPLLDKFPPISNDFDNWLATQRTRFEDLALKAAGRLVDVAMASHDFEEATAAAERMFAIDPLREDGHRYLIKACAMAGRRSDALRHYAAARELLKRELGVEPARETEALAAQVRGETQVTSSTIPALPHRSGAPTIAVLPLKQFGPATVPNHLSNGLVADITSQLACLRELSVISHGSTLDLKGTEGDLSEVGRRLGATYLVRGAMRSLGSDLRLTTELVEADTNFIVWARTSDIEPAPSFAEQDRVVAQIVNTLVPRVEEAELRRIRGKRPNSLSVYQKALIARDRLGSLERAGFLEARAVLDEVIAEEPTYAEAHALAADCYGLIVGEGWSTDRTGDVTKIEELSRTALSLDRDNLRALVFYGHRRSLLHRDYDTAQAMFRRALEIAPSSTQALQWSSLTYSFVGDSTEALRRATRALELSPCDRDASSFYFALCIAHFTAGDYEAAAEWGLRALAAPPVRRGFVGWVAASLAALGRLEEAGAIATRMMADWPNRRVRDVVDRHPYRDPERRRNYGELLLAAGFTE